MRNLFPHLTIWHWWLPQSCWWDVTASTSAPTPGESGKSTLMRFYIHLRQRHGSHYRAIVSHGQPGLDLWRHIRFCLAFVQITNQQLSCSGNLMEKSVKSYSPPPPPHPPLRKEVKVGKQLGHTSVNYYWWLKQWFIRSNLEADADGVCGAVVMADLFTCSKYLHLTHICNAPVSAETRLL